MSVSRKTGQTAKTATAGNPFLDEWTSAGGWNTPFGLPPFSRIRPEHFQPAFEAALGEHEREIESIASGTEPPTFDNVIAALELSGARLQAVGKVFWNLAGSDTTPELQAIEREMAPKLAGHRSRIYLNPDLFARIDALYAGRGEAGLDPEQLRVLELTRKDFVRAGAQLTGAGRERLQEIVSQLATLTTRFSQNVLRDESDFALLLHGEDDLAGLPASLVASAKAAAADRGHPDKYAITLSRSHVEPFLQFSQRRDLREQLFRGWTNRGANGNDSDNAAVMSQIIALRNERAQLLGYRTFADYKLDNTMAQTTSAVRRLLDRVWEGGRRRALEERDQLQRMADAEGANYQIAAHDWRYYTEKLRASEFDLDEDQLRPFFELDKVRGAAFEVAGRLFGLSFAEVTGLELYHPDARAFEVTDPDGSHVALFIADDFARPSKRSGAWMSTFRDQRRLGGEVRPVVINVLNIAKPGSGEPALLSLEEGRTLFHEFGHALHGMLSDVTYPRIAGTRVSTDFVELPSQLYEHWLLQPEVLRIYARHYRTGEPMPDELLQKVLAMRTFNQGFATVEYCASAFVDMDLHELEEPGDVDVGGFEAESMRAIGKPEEVAMRHRTPHFQHIFATEGYAAGYYSYLWSEVLDADAFQAFEEKKDIFDPDVARRLREHIYSAGGRREPAEAYTAFRGRLPEPDALMHKRGLV